MLQSSLAGSLRSLARTYHRPGHGSVAAWRLCSARGRTTFIKIQTAWATTQQTATTTTPSAIQFQSIEKKWKERWAELKSKKPQTDIGQHSKHPLMTLTRKIDALARYRRMCGYNATIERDVDPASWTGLNINEMRDQLKNLLTDFDWEREVTTCQPDYYRWTQHLFLQLYRAGLVYQKEAMVNWDPVDKTVLANEQVDNEGKSWRSGAKVERRQLRQWFIRITDYAADLLNDLQLLEGWPERVKQMQNNWIGKSIGAEFEFKLLETPKFTDPICIFTSRPDTLFGVQYIAIAPEHPLVHRDYLPKETADTVLAFASAKESLQRDAVASKEGVATGLHVRHPLTNESLPIYVARYVLSDYGTGAIMGVPAHDVRDAQFALTNKIIRSLEEAKTVVQPTPEIYTGEGILLPNCGPYAGMASKDAAAAIVRDAEKKQLGQWKTQYRLRDWLISRQRYWGAPIPVVHCPTCKVVPIPEEDLPVLLPSPKHLHQGISSLAADEEWRKTTCPKCNGPATRDTDTMDTFVDSSWYFLRFPDAHNKTRPFNGNIVGQHLPVDIYVGGVEHAILHLLYSRFFTKFLWHQGTLKGSKIDAIRGEPFKRLLTQGMVHGKTFRCPDTQRFLKPNELDLVDPNNPIIRATGQSPSITFEKMSKSKYNGVDPQATIKKHGADCTRLHMMYKAPPTEVLEWEEQSMVGMQRWLLKLSRLATQLSAKTAVPTKHFDLASLTPAERNLYRQVHQTISEVTMAFEKSFTFNTAISDLLKLTNGLSSFMSSIDKDRPLSVDLGRYSMGCLLRMLAPFAPAISEELWSIIGNHSEHMTPDSINARWPQPDPPALQADEIVCVVQVNGKLRWRFSLPAHLLGDVKAVEERARACAESARYLSAITADGKAATAQVRRVIVVRGGHLVNFIIN
ncbi:hypothetical protein BDF19DRAFT_430949 [Syncephalis fuscata]|nr:hypothetical protein BDF19DRAFT_430949 [Syncephalis fuscata]